MFLSVALSRVVPYFLFLFDDSEDAQPQVNPAERALWERIYATAAVADREGEILQTIAIYLYSTSVFIVSSVHNITHHPPIHDANFFSNPISQPYLGSHATPTSTSNE